MSIKPYTANFVEPPKVPKFGVLSNSLQVCNLNLLCLGKEFPTLHWFRWHCIPMSVRLRSDPSSTPFPRYKQLVGGLLRYVIYVAYGSQRLTCANLEGFHLSSLVLSLQTLPALNPKPFIPSSYIHSANDPKLQAVSRTAQRRPYKDSSSFKKGCAWCSTSEGSRHLSSVILSLKVYFAGALWFRT